MSRYYLSVILALLLPGTFAGGGLAAASEPALTAADKKYLDGLMREFLFDPKGAERVTVQTVVHTVWASTGEAAVDGWLVPGKDCKRGRVYFTDSASIPAPPAEKRKKVDFLALCHARYSPPPKKKDDAKKDDLDRDETFRKMRRTAVGALGDDDLAVAAWLYRLGHEELAARALAVAREGEGDPRKRLREELAWSACAGLIHAYMVRADAEALASGERLLRLYTDEVKGKGYGQARQVVAELKRRQKKGTFGQAPPQKWPEGFDKWEVKKKAAYLIDALDEVDARQWGQPGGVDLASDRRVEALIRLGDPVVPDLIDALEKDERLTRSVHFWRDFARSRTVLGVREAALTALMSILRVRVFEPAATGDNFTSRGEDAAKDMAKRLRTYWKQYGHLPFDERMMQVLTDPKTSFEAKREAADNIAHLGDDRTIATTVFSDRSGRGRSGENPAVAKFNNPTAAQAFLAAMDADLKVHDAKPVDGLHDYHRRRLENSYLGPLIDLGDKRIAPELARRSQGAATVRMRRKWADAAHWLGDPQPLRRFADDFRLGNIRLPANDRPQTNASDQPGNVELLGILHSFVSAATPEADRALDALADGRHPYHLMAAERVLKERVNGTESAPWFAHPFCLRILRAALDDTSLTGATYVIEQGNLRRKDKDGWSGTSVPAFLADPAIRRDEAPERACDTAAEKLGELVVGLPRYHPLFKDADNRLIAFKAALDRFAGHYRRATWREEQGLGLSSWTPAYLPDIRPLGRAATPDDVKAGKAVFHLDGKGKPADLKLPAVAVRKHTEPRQPPGVLIVQAEVGPEGRVTYGIITRQEVRAVPAHELTGIKTFAALDQEEKEAAAKKKDKKD